MDLLGKIVGNVGQSFVKNWDDKNWSSVKVRKQTQSMNWTFDISDTFEANLEWRAMKT
jgi:hypothetical protein